MPDPCICAEEGADSSATLLAMVKTISLCFMASSRRACSAGFKVRRIGACAKPKIHANEPAFLQHDSVWRGRDGGLARTITPRSAACARVAADDPRRFAGVAVRRAP